MATVYTKEKQYLPMIAEASKKYNVPVALIMGHIRQESNFNPRAYRAEPQINDASYGMMQLLLKTASALDPNATAEKLYIPEYNIDLGTKLIAQNIQRFKNLPDAIAAYNAGIPRKNEKGEYVNSKGVTNVDYYVKQVTKYMNQYHEWINTGQKTMEVTIWDAIIPILVVGLGIWIWYSMKNDEELDDSSEYSREPIEE